MRRLAGAALGVVLVAAAVLVVQSSAGAPAAPPQQPLRVMMTVSPARVDTDAVLSLQRLAGTGSAQHACTATLIKPAWVVTAAHCVTPAPEHIKAGKNRLKEERCKQVDLNERPIDPEVPPLVPLTVRGSSKNYAKGGETATVVEVHVVPGWDWGTAGGPMRDLALLRLDHPMTITPVPIATSAPSTDNKTLAVGWSTWPDRCGGIITEQQQWELKPTDCPINGTEGHICGTTGGEVGPCEGVSGGPLFTAPSAGPRAIIGVYSHAPGGRYCGDVQSVYTRLADYRGFVSSTISS